MGYTTHQPLFRYVSNHPTLVIACACDLHVQYWQLLGLGADRSMELRTPGNSADEASIGSALKVSPATELILCGHLGCQVIEKLERQHHRDTAQIPEGLRAGFHLVQQHYPQLEGRARREVLVQENVLCQLDRLARMACVATAGVKLSGFVLDDERVELWRYDSAVQQFRAEPSA